MCRSSSSSSTDNIPFLDYNLHTAYARVLKCTVEYTQYTNVRYRLQKSMLEVTKLTLEGTKYTL